MDKLVILGSGAAAGVPTISKGWGECDPCNPKNKRSRAGIYVEIKNTRIQIDTSADFRNQLLDNQIKLIDAVLYTHTHADHTAGIDDLRAINYAKHADLDIYATELHLKDLRQRFAYVFNDYQTSDITHRPQLKINCIQYDKPFHIHDVEILPLEFAGHPMPTTGFLIDKGRLLIVPDYKNIPQKTMNILQKINVDVLIMPLTNISACPYHAGMDEDLQYIRQIAPKRVFLTHMSQHCDYDSIEAMTDQNIHPAYDGLTIDL